MIATTTFWLCRWIDMRNSNVKRIHMFCPRRYTPVPEIGGLVAARPLPTTGMTASSSCEVGFLYMSIEMNIVTCVHRQPHTASIPGTPGSEGIKKNGAAAGRFKKMLCFITRFEFMARNNVRTCKLVRTHQGHVRMHACYSMVYYICTIHNGAAGA